MEKPFIGAAERNKEYIFEHLTEIFSGFTTVLEVGSGTGQHAVYFASKLKHLFWQPSDLSERLPGIAAWCEESLTENIFKPMELDISAWPNFTEKYDAVFASNVIHYIESRYVDKFFEGSKNTLKSNGLVVLYGPFKHNNEYSSVGDEQLDLLLKSENKSFGIRNLEELKNVACLHNFEFLKSIHLPANNKLVCWKKKSSNKMLNGVNR